MWPRGTGHAAATNQSDFSWSRSPETGWFHDAPTRIEAQLQIVSRLQKCNLRELNEMKVPLCFICHSLNWKLNWWALNRRGKFFFHWFISSKRCGKVFFSLTFYVGQHCVTTTLGPKPEFDTGCPNLSRMRLFLAIPSEKTNKKKQQLWYAIFRTLAVGNMWHRQVLRNTLGHAPSPWSVSNGADALIFLLVFFFNPTQELMVQMQKLRDVHDFKKIS